MGLSYLPLSVYNKSSDGLVSLTYENEQGDKLYSYTENNKWQKPFTVITFPNKVKLVMVDDITQDMVIDQDFVNSRDL